MCGTRSAENFFKFMLPSASLSVVRNFIILMGYKLVCFNCRKSFNRRISDSEPGIKKCPTCGGKLAFFNHKFRPPKLSDKKAWHVVKFLFDHGFNYQHIEESSTTLKFGLRKASGNYVDYPTNMKDAKEFVIKYKSQAEDLNTRLGT